MVISSTSDNAVSLVLERLGKDRGVLLDLLDVCFELGLRSLLERNSNCRNRVLVRAAY